MPAVAERLQELSYLALQRVEDDQPRPGRRRSWKGHDLRELDDAAVAAFLSRGHGDCGELALLPSGAGRAMAARSPPSARPRPPLATATPGRVRGRADWTDPAQDQARLAAARRSGAVVEPLASGVSVNDLTDEARPASAGPTARARWPGWRR
jgi:hypothetical protein